MLTEEKQHADDDAGNDGAAEKRPEIPTVNDSSDASDTEDRTKPESTNTRPQTLWQRTYATVFWTPRRLRWEPDSPPQFSLGLDILPATPSRLPTRR